MKMIVAFMKVMYESSGFPMFLFVKIDMFFVFWYLHMIVALLG